MKHWRQWLMHRQIQAAEIGQGLVEYALILIFVAVVLIAILTVLSPGLVNIYENIYNALMGL
jgi:pilus assembly protein Flp/PilA